MSPPFFFMVDTASTEAQRETELECQPYFVDLDALPRSQLDHLRETGLLAPPAPAPARAENEGQDDANDDLGRISGTGSSVCLLRRKHVEYLEQVWRRQQSDGGHGHGNVGVVSSYNVKSSFASLDSSRTWMLYWCLHGTDLLLEVPGDGGDYGDLPRCSKETCDGMVQFLEKCWSEQAVEVTTTVVVADTTTTGTNTSSDHLTAATSATTTRSTTTTTSVVTGGGFGGGPGQIPHAATNYAAVMALCILSSRTDSALALLASKRPQLNAWMRSLQNSDDGSFRMHHDGEVDLRATYCLLAVAKLLNVEDGFYRDEALSFLKACQTFEGGFGGEPFSEAHGGYAYCATAALFLLAGCDRKSRNGGDDDGIDLYALAGWLSRRQMSYEGGFNGRSNKLVDGCYSFWQGGAMAIVSKLLALDDSDESLPQNYDPWLDSVDEDITGGGGAATKDDALLFDHFMLERYILLCAQASNGGLRDKPSKSRDFYHSCYNLSGLSVAQHCCEKSGDAVHFGHPTMSRVARTHPVYNIRVERARRVLDYFAGSPLPRAPAEQQQQQE